MKQLKERAVALAVVALLFSCNAAKKIAQQDTDIDALKAKWIGDYILTHPCPTIAAFNLDSICAIYYLGISIEPEPGTVNAIINGKWVSRKDTVLPLMPRNNVKFISGTGNWNERPQAFTISGSGVVSSIGFQSRKDTVHIAVPYEDSRKVNLLLDSVKAKDVRIATLSGSIAASAKDCNTAIKSADKRASKWMWLFIAACVLIAVRLGISIYTFIHGGVLGKIKL